MPGAEQSSEFAATRWSVVIAAADNQDESRARRALSELAGIYWFPLYAYLRRQGHSATEAEDLTQAFFTRIIEKKLLTSADSNKGKFRSFLLASLKNFTINENDKSRTQKRGGQHHIIMIDQLSAEARYHSEPADMLSPERVYEQRWAWAVLDQVMVNLRERYRQRGEEKLFDALKGTLTTTADTSSYSQIADDFDMSVQALTVAVHRLRKRFRDTLRSEIAQTVSDESLIEDEIQYLLSCL